VVNINDLEEFAKFCLFFANGKLFGLFELN